MQLSIARQCKSEEIKISYRVEYNLVFKDQSELFLLHDFIFIYNGF